jgi:hypothetical protein
MAREDTYWGDPDQQTGSVTDSDGIVWTRTEESGQQRGAETPQQPSGGVSVSRAKQRAVRGQLESYRRRLWLITFLSPIGLGVGTIVLLSVSAVLTAAGSVLVATVGVIIAKILARRTIHGHIRAVYQSSSSWSPTPSIWTFVIVLPIPLTEAVATGFYLGYSRLRIAL